MYLNILNGRSKQEIESYIKSPTQALLIHAPHKFGANEVANEIAHKIIEKPLIIEPAISDNAAGSIGVDDIRWLYDVASRKTDKKNVIVIQSAETMTKQAQNAFLKILEEPSNNTHFILSCEDTSSLLSTLLSRVQSIHISRISRDESKKLVTLYDNPERNKEQILFLAEGLPREIIILSTDNNYFESRMISVKDAMTLLSGSSYQKTLLIHKYKENRKAAIQMIDDCLTILKNTIKSQEKQGAINKLDILIAARDRLEANSMVRITLMGLMV